MESKSQEKASQFTLVYGVVSGHIIADDEDMVSI